MKDDIKKAFFALREGGIIVYPTDTIWGIGCDATNAPAVQRLYEIKQREPEKSMLVLVDSPGMLEAHVAQVPEIAWELLDVNDKPMTIIYPKAKNLAENLPATDGSVGIRLTSDPFCQQLIRRLRKPLVSTSANFSGQPAPAFFSEISPEILEKANYVVRWRQDEQTRAKPSSIIKIGLKNEIQIIRK